jgi:hypothetical protein
MSAKHHKSRDHHHTAAEHHENAAKHHREAAKHYDDGDHEKGGHHAHKAHGHACMRAIMRTKRPSTTPSTTKTSL